MASLYLWNKSLKEVILLYSYDFMPIMAVYQDEKGELYLSKISDWRNGIIFIVTRTTKKIIRDLIKRKISINIAMKRGSEVKYQVIYENGAWRTKEILFNQINPYDLAASRTYLDYMEDDVEENFKNFIKEEL